jgi:hypothetical protein
MTRKDVLVSTINNHIKVIDNALLIGLVRTTEKGDEKLNFDISNNVVAFDDKYDMFSYHKVIKEGFEEIQSRGKNKTYNITANINLIVYTSSRDTTDLLVSAMSRIKDVVLLSVDYDSLKIIRQETNKTDFDPSKYIFSINYDLRYKSSECTSICE